MKQQLDFGHLLIEVETLMIFQRLVHRIYLKEYGKVSFICTLTEQELNNFQESLRVAAVEAARLKGEIVIE